jgi:UDP-N-acetylglucosamine:LPS N-acetylglucosamine transferase
VHATSIHDYPLSRVLDCFDLVVAGAGYNTVHELLEARVPGLLVPIPTAQDDQYRRAEVAHRHGLAVTADPGEPGALERTLGWLLKPENRSRLQAALEARRPTDGAAEAARAVALWADRSQRWLS